MAYQNEDGGFGHGLEADFLNPNSSPIQTWWAIRILREIGLYAPGQPVVSKAVRYLESGAFFDGHCWASDIPSNNDYPHAPWWTWRSPESDAPWSYNPTASLTGWLVHVTQSDFAFRLADESVNAYLSMDSCLDKHTLRCFLELYRDIKASAPHRFDISAFEKRLRNDISECIFQSADNWNSYSPRPSDFISGLEDPFFDCIAEIAEKECCFLIETQLENGAWPITWQWKDYPDAFAVSKKHWQSILTISNLLFLIGMNRI